MPHINVKAVPRLVSPPDIVAFGVERTADEWSEAIAGLRPRLLALANQELCGLLRELYLRDLFCLVVSDPFDNELLARLQDGLSERVWEDLRDDCEKQGAALLGDLAAGVFARVNEALTALEESRATKEQQDRLLALSRRMLELEDGAFKFCVEGMAIPAMEALFIVTGGLESAWSQRARQFISAKAWEMIAEDYPAMSAEPLKADTLAECITNIPALMEGQPWPDDGEYLTPEENDAWLKEIGETLDSINRREKTWKFKLSLLKCRIMNTYENLSYWFRSKFSPKK